MSPPNRLSVRLIFVASLLVLLFYTPPPFVSGLPIGPGDTTNPNFDPKIHFRTFEDDGDDESATSQKSAPDALEFMRHFGYLERGPPDSEALYTKEAVTAALKEVQRFGAIPQTGKLDEQTKKLLATPRCGNPDVAPKETDHPRRRQKRYIIGGQGWKKRNIKYHLSNWTYKLGNETFVLASLERAFRAWSDYSGLKFRRTDDPHAADMVMAFGRYAHGDRHPFDGPGNVLAHAFFPYEYGNFGGDVHFDEDEDWKPDTRGDDSAMDFFTVAVHEIGHALGLSHSPEQESIMFPYYKGAEGQDFSLAYDDILAMYELYINRPLVDDDEDNSSRPRVTSSTTTTTTTTTTPKTSPSPSPTYPSYPEGGVGVVGVEPVDYDYQDDDVLVYNPDDKEKDKSKTKPDLCVDGFDTFSNLRGELFAFKDEYLWRYSGRRDPHPGYPAKIRQMFAGFPENITKIDAVYERPTDGSLVFFSGAQYWVFNGYNMLTGSPHPLTDLGLPSDLAKVDAVFSWGKNGKTYLFANKLYWRYDEFENSVEPGYPQEIRFRWGGVQDDIDAVFTWRDGTTYFFKDNRFSVYDDYNVVSEVPHESPTSRHWFGCQ